MRQLLKASLLIFCLAFSCKPQEKASRPTIKMVEDILLNKNSKEYALLSLPPKPSGDIAIIGNQTACEELGDYLLQFDSFDNVDGSSKSDDLPDFAGETFLFIQEDGSLRNIDTLELRRQTVLKVLASLDTLVHLSPYDVEGVNGKKPAKLIIFNDPYMTKYGLFDVDTLFRRIGSEIKVCSSIDLSIDKVFKDRKDKAQNIAILYNPKLYEGELILNRFLERAPKTQGSKYLAFPVTRSDSLLYYTVEDLMTRDVCLDALIVDDYSVNIDELKLEYADMISVLNQSSLNTSKYFSDYFQIIDTKELVAEYCFNLLRKDNLFTHTIAFPQLYFLNAVQSKNNDGNILLIPNTYVQE